LGAGSEGLLALKSIASPSSPPSRSGKSNETSLSSESLIDAEKGRPSRLRKPSSGPTRRVESSVSASGVSSCRPPMIFQKPKSQPGTGIFL